MVRRLPPSVHNSEDSGFFFFYLFIQTEKAAVSTIKGYRAMLSFVFKFCLPEISSSPILKDLVRSFDVIGSSPITSYASMGFGQDFGVLVRPSFRAFGRSFLSE